MKEFASTYGGREASTEDFQALVTKRGARDASWFFNQWVHGTEYPRITIQYSVTPNEKGALFSGTISQRGVSKDFVSVVPVRVALGKGSGTVRLAVQGESSTFSIQVPAVPSSFEFNPLQAWLCDLEVKKL
jgi:aminopeptidase N